MAVDPDDLVANCWPQLHAEGEADAVFIDEAQLKRDLTDALKDMAQRFSVFVVRHTARALVQGTLYYNAPPRHLSTLHIAILETGKPLTPSSTKEREFGSTAYATTQATALKPIRWWIQDKHAVNTIGIVPVPGATDAGNHLDIIYHEYPCDIEDGIETIKTYGDYLEAKMMERAYEADSDFNMPEAAQSYGALAALYESALSVRGKAQ